MIPVNSFEERIWQIRERGPNQHLEFKGTVFSEAYWWFNFAVLIKWQISEVNLEDLSGHPSWMVGRWRKIYIVSSWPVSREIWQLPWEEPRVINYPESLYKAKEEKDSDAVQCYSAWKKLHESSLAFQIWLVEGQWSFLALNGKIILKVSYS